MHEDSFMVQHPTLHKLKQTAGKLERKWCSIKLEEFCSVWQDSLKTNRMALHSARAACYSTLIKDNKNNLWFLFSTVATRTENQSSIEPCNPVMILWTCLIIKLYLLERKFLTVCLQLSLKTWTIETARRPDIYLCFAPIDLQKLTSTIISSRPATCLLDQLLTRLKKSALLCLHRYIKVSPEFPQGSVLDPILFILYMPPSGNIIGKHYYFWAWVDFFGVSYADDIQLYLSLKPEETNNLTKLQVCVADTWPAIFLLLNSDKPEVTELGPKHPGITL